MKDCKRYYTNVIGLLALLILLVLGLIVYELSSGKEEPVPEEMQEVEVIEGGEISVDPHEAEIASLKYALKQSVERSNYYYQQYLALKNNPQVVTEVVKGDPYPVYIPQPYEVLKKEVVYVHDDDDDDCWPPGHCKVAKKHRKH